MILLACGVLVAISIYFYSALGKLDYQFIHTVGSQMVQALAEDGVKTLEDFATCADWELAGGWTTVDGERVKDDGLLEPFDVSLEEAQDMVMTARVMLGWVDPDDLVSDEAEELTEEAEA